MNYNFLQNKNILITGGTGSLGRELVHEVLKHDPKVVRVFDVDETEQFEFHQEYELFAPVPEYIEAIVKIGFLNV